MLPFLKNQRQQTGVIVKNREPDAKPQDEMQPEMDPGIVAAAQDLINSIKAGDAQGAAQAMKAAFDIMESMPHDEAPEAEEMP